jgi:peptidoglycan/xylan/chitin deacetylase (PgdA/CDA1 family)
MDRIVFLMYHELELSGRALCQSAPGYTRYILQVGDFRAQMAWLKDAGWRGFSVSTALDFPGEPGVVITFDDGCETDLITAAPLLKEFGFEATFYVTTGLLGTPGYLSPQQLQELGRLGFEIGCHSMTHAYLSDSSESELQREIVEAKQRLEQILSQPIEHFSCPGGRYNQRAIETAQRAGYRTLATSRRHANSRRTPQFELGRVAVMRDTTINAFERICRGEGLRRLQLIDFMRTGAKSMLGNSSYDTFRALFLGRNK